MALKPNTKAVFDYLQAQGDENFTAQDVADALGFEDKRVVDGIFTSAIQRKGYGIRVAKEIELEDGSHRQVKFLKLTDAGKNFDTSRNDEE